jgi:hypothetical protein
MMEIEYALHNHLGVADTNRPPGSQYEGRAMEPEDKLPSVRSKYQISGVQLYVLTHMAGDWELGESGKEFPPFILQKGGIGSGLERTNVSRSSINAMLRKGLICRDEGRSGVFTLTEAGHHVLKAYRKETE